MLGVRCSHMSYKSYLTHKTYSPPSTLNHFAFPEVSFPPDPISMTPPVNSCVAALYHPAFASRTKLSPATSQRNAENLSWWGIAAAMP